MRRFSFGVNQPNRTGAEPRRAKSKGSLVLVSLVRFQRVGFVRKLCTFGSLFVATCLFAAQSAYAQSEDQVKAAFLLNFARYVEWPAAAFPGPDAPIRMCLIGTDGFKSVVSNTVEGKAVHERTVSVEAIQTLSEASGCHLLFVGADALTGAAEVDALADLRAAHVLTIGNREDFAEDAGIANFYRAGKKMRFEVNPKSAEEAGLEVSSRLLRLARIVES